MVGMRIHAIDEWSRLATGTNNQFSEVMGSPQPDLDDLFRALSQRERRQILRYLDRQDASVAVEKLAAALATDRPARSTEQVTLTLTHQHLPLLEDTHLIERTSQDRVTVTDTAAAAIDVLDIACYYFE